MSDVPRANQVYAPPAAANAVEGDRPLGFWFRFGAACLAASLVLPPALVFLPSGLSPALWAVIILVGWFVPVVWVLLPELRVDFSNVSYGRLALVSFGFLLAAPLLAIIIWGVVGVAFSLFESWRYGT